MPNIDPTKQVNWQVVVESNSGVTYRRVVTDGMLVEHLWEWVNNGESHFYVMAVNQPATKLEEDNAQH